MTNRARFPPRTLAPVVLSVSIIGLAPVSQGAVFDPPEDREIGRRILAATPQLQSTGYLTAVDDGDDLQASAVLIAPNAVLTAAHLGLSDQNIGRLRFGMGDDTRIGTGPETQIRTVVHLSPPPIVFGLEQDFTVGILEANFGGPKGLAPEAQIAVLSASRVAEGDEVAVVGYGRFESESETNARTRDLYSDRAGPDRRLLSDRYFLTSVTDSRHPSNGIPEARSDKGGSGGGAYRYQHYESRWELAGIVSARRGPTTFYAEIAPSTRQWIEEVLAAHPPDETSEELPFEVAYVSFEERNRPVLQFAAEPRYEYQLLRSRDLRNWTPLVSASFADSNGRLASPETAEELPAGFFRIARQPLTE